MTTRCILNIIAANWGNIEKAPKTPKNVDWSKFNMQKDLIPTGKSGKVFINKKPIRINRSWEKDTPEGYDVIYICGHPLFKKSGMIYWYCIGDVDFDVREMRRNAQKYAKFKEDYKADHNHSNPFESLLLVAYQIDEILQRVESHWDFFSEEPPMFKLIKHQNQSTSDSLPF